MMQHFYINLKPGQSISETHNIVVDLKGITYRF